MRRKRLNHAADILCDMFCGWRLTNSYKELEHLGSGNLVIDALTEDCRFNGQPIHTVSIAVELSHWLKADLAKHNIPSSAIKMAQLNVELSTFTADIRPSSRIFHMGKNGKPIKKGDFYQVQARLHSIIITDEASYERMRSHDECWPVGWPHV